jgi:hypothetical protein
MENEMVFQDNKQKKDKKILSTTYKLGGFYLKIKSIITAVIAIIFIGFGIYFSIKTSIAGLVFVGIGLCFLLGSWIYWKRAKRMSQGKFY